jgi:hypothetical protein
LDLHQRASYLHLACICPSKDARNGVQGDVQNVAVYRDACPVHEFGGNPDVGIVSGIALNYHVLVAVMSEILNVSKSI